MQDHRPPTVPPPVRRDPSVELADVHQLSALSSTRPAHSREETDYTLASGTTQLKQDESLAEEGLFVAPTVSANGGPAAPQTGWARGWKRGSATSSTGCASAGRVSPSATLPEGGRLVPVGLWQTRFSDLLTRLESRHPRVGRTLIWLRGPSPAWIETRFPPFPLPYAGHRLARLEIWCTAKLMPVQRRRQYTTPIFLLAWLLGLAFLARKSFFVSSTNMGEPSWIDATTSYWSKDDQCGLNGTDCEPFSDSSLVFRCPAQSLSTKLLNQRTIGAQSVNYKPLVVGGFDDLATYRADSWICAAAIQQGLYSDGRGGCGKVDLVGEFEGYVGGERNGVSSIGFDTGFPSSYRFVAGVDQGGCQDLRWNILGFGVSMSFILSFLIRPAPQALYWSLFCFGYWHIVLASDPSALPPDISNGFKSFLPALFAGETFWRHSWRWVLPAFEESGFVIERTVWYLAGYWVGVLENISFDKLPIDRLTPHDIKQAPGGLIAVIILAIFLFFAVLNQLRVIRRTGWLFFYLKWYVVGGIVIAILASLPGLSFRLHHYVAAICLLPGTAFVTRPSALFQGFLTGLFLNGIARWGFDSILETPASLIGDGALGTSLPIFLTNSTNFAQAATDGFVSWMSPTDAATEGEGWNGFALLVDDVLRQTGTATNFSLAGLEAGVVHYFRLAYQNAGSSGDFTKAAVAFLSNSTWIDPATGPS
ncbi:hypothetical protein JCM11641_007760 [Rhodosporidiobolus odoratus]